MIMAKALKEGLLDKFLTIGYPKKDKKKTEEDSDEDEEDEEEKKKKPRTNVMGVRG